MKTEVNINIRVKLSDTGVYQEPVSITCLCPGVRFDYMLGSLKPRLDTLLSA